MRIATDTTYTFLIPEEAGYAEAFEKYHDMSMWKKYIGTDLVSYTNKSDVKADAERIFNLWKSWHEAKKG